MTTTEVQAGADLDALVAEKVMGERFIHRLSDGGVVLGHGPDSYSFCPSTDIVDAMEVLEKMREHGEHGCAAELWTEMVGDEIGWQVCFIQRGEGSHRALALTLPEAICRAALAAKED